jgi:spore coat polysaccharide biosynthesis protein SpsF (cytidylyltransferase family)
VDDLKMARAAFALLGSGWPDAGYTDLVELLDQHPEVVAINTQVRQKALKDG